MNASSLADEHTQHVAERLGTAIESSTRLALLQALSDAAGTISAELAPSSVELRIVGQDPEFVVSVQAAESEPTLLLPDARAWPSTPRRVPPSKLTTSPWRASLWAPALGKGARGSNGFLRRDLDQRVAHSRGHGRLTNVAVTPGVAAARIRVRQMPPLADGASPNVVFGFGGPFGPHGVFGAEGPFGPGEVFRRAPEEDWT